MGRNLLKFNQQKTELIIFCPKKHESKFQNFSLLLGDTRINNSPVVKNLGVYLDCTLSMLKHINEKSRSAHFQIKNIWSLRKCLTEDATKSLVNALVIPKLDYCNSLLFGVKQNSLMKLQRVQNSAARLIKRVRKRQHITPSLKELHWLPVKYRIEFKILLLTFKTLNGNGPSYIRCLLSEKKCLRSDNTKLVIPTMNLVKTGERAFSHAAPRLWNQLPQEIRKSETIVIFKKKLKTFYFRKYFGES